jgi:hypothetical protein
MSNYGMRYMLTEVLQTTNKEERILDTLQPYYQGRAVYHNRGQEKLVYELEYLGKAKNDDNADIFATVVSQLVKPSQIIEWKGTEIKKEGYKKGWWLKEEVKGHLDWRLR